MLRRLSRRFWDAHSHNWDDSLVNEAVAAHIDELAELLAEVVVPGGVVADLGCGTGNHLRALAARGLSAIGVDSSPGMLARARTKDAALARADLSTLPIRPGSLDGVISVYAAQFLDVGAFCADVAGLLRPGGAFVLEVPHGGRNPDRDLRGLPTRYRVFQSVKTVVATAGSAAGAVRHHQPDAVRAALTNAGFAVHSCTTSTVAVTAVARGQDMQVGRDGGAS